MPDPRKPRAERADATRAVPTPRRERPARLSREELAARIREQNEQAVDEALPFGWKLALYASRLNENINPVLLAQQIAREFTPEKIAESRANPEYMAFVRGRAGTATPEQLAQGLKTVGSAVGGFASHLASGVARGDPAALADATAIVAPIVGPKLYNATRFAKVRAARSAASSRLARVRAEPRPNLPAEGMERPTFERRSAERAAARRPNAVSETMQRIERASQRPEGVREPHVPAGAPSVLGASNPIEALVNEYRVTRGITSEPMPPVTEADASAHRALAKYYDETPSQHNDPRVRASYDALWRVIEDQYEFLKSKGYRMEVVDSPEIQSVYATPEEMFDDIANNKRLKINATTAEQANLRPGQKPVVEGQAHPIWTNHQNNVFRFVHDLLGHGATRRGFDLPGEETAFRAHAMTMPREAMPALVSETRGQTATYFHGRNPNTFVEQKALAFPESMLGDYAGIRAGRPPLVRAAEEGLAGNGFTVDAAGQPYKGTGFAVADPNFTKILDESNPNALEDFINDPAVQAELKKPNRHLGGWRDPQTGKREINVTTTFSEDQFPAAIAFARQGKQKTIGEFKDGQYVRDRQYIAAPAIIGADGVTYRGANHELARAVAAKAMRATPEGMAAMRANGGSAQKRGTVDGFVTGDESFVDRTQGRLLAPDAEGRAYKELHSSDLNLPEQSHAAEYPVPRDLIAASQGLRPIRPSKIPGEGIASAAVKVGDRVVPGVNHGDAYNRYEARYGTEPPDDAVNGFLTEQGEFVDRREAGRIADAAQQRRNIPGTPLTYEDIIDWKSQSDPFLPERGPFAPNPRQVGPDTPAPSVPDVTRGPAIERPDLSDFMGTGANSMTPEDLGAVRILGRPVAPAPAGPPVLGGNWKALDDLLPYLSPDEVRRVLSPRGTLLRNSIDARARLLGPDEPLIHAALQGQLARGGYESVLPELRAIYGPDAERFAGIWAAVSPRQLNEAALGMTQDIFGRWRDVGGLSASPSVMRDLAARSQLPARFDNTLAALTAVDPLGLQLSGNKVESFFPNLLAHLNPRANLSRVTLDALQGAGMGINPNRFGNYGTYLTGSGQIRRVADALTRGTGVPWAPAEAQEAMWSTIRALQNLPGAETAARAGRLPDMIGDVTPELAGQQWSPQVFRDVLSEGGAMGSDIVPALRFQLGDRDPLRLLAETVQNSLRKRYRIR